MKLTENNGSFPVMRAAVTTEDAKVMSLHTVKIDESLWSDSFLIMLTSREQNHELIIY